MEKIIEKLKEVERDLLNLKAKATTNQTSDELSRALRYLADARTCLRVAGVLTPPPSTPK